MFNISDKVVCVSDEFGDWMDYFESVPRLGGIYVIRGVRQSVADPGECVVHLVGLVGAFRPEYGVEQGFAAIRFRKLSEIKAENALKQSEPCPEAKPSK